jgi:hypothetical protein
MVVVRNASGHHRDEARWPLLPLAAPRGARELFWHVGVLLAFVLPLLLLDGWLVFGVVVSVNWYIKLRPVELVRVALMYALTGAFVAVMFTTPSVALDAVAHIFIWRRISQIGLPLEVALGCCLELSVSLLAVATLVGFDRRRVNRATVDLRVWQRQQTRRRQLLRQWHRSADLPELAA